jgi:transcription elongation factor Elf1
MKIKLNSNFRCSNCGGMKYVGDPYFAMQRYWIDVTCIKCAHSVDIEINRLNSLLSKIGFKTIQEFLPTRTYAKQQL